ncbi:acyltransferase [Microbacterium gorillae]|uniref:acyltransferase n=1 Tax=Microbacterium gorillae TaxID=1231063 RepID=UPI000590BE03|nr:acyltransferase family protein [Microbacterium gorillae]
MSSPTSSPRRWSYDLLRVISIVGVIAIHVFGAVVGDPARPHDGGWWYAVAMDIGFIWVVPVFVMLSGALVLAPRQHAGGPVAFYRRRLVRLAPAFVFWQIFYIVVFRVWLTEKPTGAGAAIASVVEGRPYTHLYFLWLIVGLYAVAPVLSAFLTQGGERRALWFAGIVLGATVLTTSSAGVLTVLGVPTSTALVALTQWLPYVGYFLAGWALRAVVLRGPGLVFATVGTLAVIAGLIVQFGLRAQAPVLNALVPVSYYGPAVALAALGCFVVGNSVFAEFAPTGRLAAFVTAISDAAFGVFLVHFAVMLGLRALPIFHAAPGSAVLATVQWVAVVLISFAIVLLARRVPMVRRLF